MNVQILVELNRPADTRTSVRYATVRPHGNGRRGLSPPLRPDHLHAGPDPQKRCRHVDRRRRPRGGRDVGRGVRRSGWTGRRRRGHHHPAQRRPGATADGQRHQPGTHRVGLDLQHPLDHRIVAPVQVQTSVSYATVPRTAWPETTTTFDPVPSPSAPGQTSKSITVTILGDDKTESDEHFLLTLNNARGVRLGDNAVITITDDDPRPALVVDAVSTQVRGVMDGQQHGAAIRVEHRTRGKGLGQLRDRGRRSRRR